MWSNGAVDGVEPIEVELVSHDEQPSRRRRAGGAADPWSSRSGFSAGGPDPGSPAETAAEPGDDPDPSFLATDRGRLVTTAVVVGVVALLLGWMLGRSAGDDDLATAVEDEVTTTVERRSQVSIVGDAVEPPDFEDEAVEDGARPQPTRTEGTVRTTTVVPDEATVEPIAVDPRLLGIPVRLVGVEAGGALVEVDLATGMLIDHHIGRVSVDNSGLIVGPDWVVLGGGGSTARVAWSDGSESRITLGDAWRPLHVPGTETFWRTPNNGPGPDGMVLSLVDLAGEEVGPTIELPPQAWPSSVDPGTGGLVVSGYGRSYAFTPEGVEYLGVGNVVAIVADTVVLFDCDEMYECGLHRVDRATGERTPVPLDPLFVGEAPLVPAYYYGMPGAVSPDGRWVSVMGSGWDRNVAGITELETGRFVEFGDTDWPPSVSWSPDGRYAFSIGNLTVTVYDTVTDELFPVFTDSVRWSRVGVRPGISKDVSPEDASPAEEPVEG